VGPVLWRSRSKAIDKKEGGKRKRCVEKRKGGPVKIGQKREPKERGIARCFQDGVGERAPQPAQIPKEEGQN